MSFRKRYWQVCLSSQQKHSSLVIETPGEVYEAVTLSLKRVLLSRNKKDIIAVLKNLASEQKRVKAMLAARYN